MHHIFSIDEILRIILLTFAPEGWEWNRPVNRQQLLHCAMTCSAFKNPSLDLLWQNIDSLAPLLQLLPSDAVVRDGKRWVLGRPLVQQDWIPFKRYAKHVRDLSLDCGVHSDYDLDEDSWFPDIEIDLFRIPSQFPPGFFASFQQSFNSSNPGAILLPHLTTFTLSVTSASDFECCPMMMASKLRRIALGCDWRWDSFPEESGLEGFFDSITYSPSRHSVQALYLPRGMDVQENPHLRDSYLRMLSLLRALQKVGLSPPLISDSDGMRCLAEKSDLRHIEVGYAAFTEPKDNPFSQGYVFPKLCSLEVDTRCLRYILPIVGRGAITSIQTWCTDYLSPREPVFRDFCQTTSLIAQRCAALEILGIKFNTLPIDNDATKSMHAILSPLLSGCQSVTRVDIMLNGPESVPQFSLSDDDYFEISQAWRHLQSFTFYLAQHEWKRPIPAKPCATLRGAIQPFATYCRSLHTLKLGSTFLCDPNDATPTQPFACLDILDVSSTMLSDISDQGGLAKPVDKLDNKIWSYLVFITNGGTIKLK